MDSQRVKRPFRGPSDQKQVPDRKLPHFIRNFMRKQGMHQVRLFEIACHLGKQFVSGDSHIYRKSELTVNLILYARGSLHGRAKQLFRSSHVDKALINAALLYRVRIPFQYGNKCL